MCSKSQLLAKHCSYLTSSFCLDHTGQNHRYVGLHAGCQPPAYYVAHYVWPYHETVRMSVCLSVRLSVCHVSYLENGAR